MNAGKKELLCSKCRKRVSYQIFKRPAKTLIKDLEIEYEEYYGICDECKSEIYVPGVDDRNEELIEKIYREKKGLITIKEIQNILDKYNIDKRPLSKLLGFGELTITRYLDGQLPSKRYSDLLYKILHNDDYMKNITKENRDLVSSVTVKKVLQAIESHEKEKNVQSQVEKIALYIINSGRDVTNLLLQKLLYYVKGISCLFEESSIIPEACEAWKFGPVFPNVYEKYKDFGKQEIKTKLSGEYVNNLLSEKEKYITDYVLNNIGIYNAWFLKDLTHNEEPWIITRKGLDDDNASRNIMDDDLITNYFMKMNDLYNLMTPDGIDLYVNEMKKKLYQ